MAVILWARDWTGITSNGNETPDWWFYYYFGTIDLFDTNLDSFGYTFNFDYQYGYDPNVVIFSVQFTNDINDYVSASPVNGNISIIGGEPFYEAILVNDTNQAHAVWQPFTTTNLTVALGLTNGVYTVLVGLRGLPENAQQSWVKMKVILNTVGPALIITNPVNSTVSQPIIQLQGLVNEALSKLTFDVSNASGISTNEQGYWQASFYDSNASDFTTNAFQCYDIKLTNGLNTIILHAIDLMGNTTTTNVSFTLNYAGASSPVLSILWPPNKTVISGSNFTLQAHVNDDTATVLAQITDSHGDTNIVQGLVERSGLVWVQNLPLASGTNVLILTATNAAGRSTITNVDLIQSAVMVTMDPLTQFNQAYVDVTGTISDPSDSLTVNGTNAYYIDTNGDWEADNVPVSPTGTAIFNIEVYMGDPTLVGSQYFSQQQPPAVEMMSYDMDYVGSDYPQMVHWTYRAGGYDLFNDDDVVAITPLTNGIAYVDTFSGSFDPPWEYASVNQSDEYYHAQMHVMIAPQGQMPIGTNQLLYLVSAVAFGCVDGPDDVDGFNIIDAVFDTDTGGLWFDGYGYSGGTWPMPPQWLQINGQTLTNTYQVNDAGADWGQTLISAPAGASVDVTPVATQVSNYWDYTFYVQATNVTLQIVDSNTGNILSGQTNTVIVGQQMNLTCQLSATNAWLKNSMLTNFQWTVPGLTFSNWLNNPESAILYTNYPLTNSGVTFYWIDGASSRTVQCSAMINGATVTGQATFNILRPTAQIITTGGSVALDTYQDAIRLHCGDVLNIPGMLFNVTNLSFPFPPQLAGNTNIAWFQLATYQNRQEEASSGQWYQKLGTNVCDGGVGSFGLFYPYPFDLSFVYPIATDSPKSTNLVSYVGINFSDSFDMYLMYQPIGGQWVPLQKVSWHWDGAGSWNGTNWILTSYHNPGSPLGSNITTHPTWNGNTDDLQYNPE